VCVVLLLYDFADVSIEKISLLGTELAVGRPEVLVAGLWLLFAYFLLRYYQFFTAAKSDRISEAFQVRYSHLMLQHYLPGFEHEFPKDRLRVHYDAKERIATIEHFTQNGAGEVLWNPVPLESRFVVRLWMRIRAAFRIAASTPYVTEELLPFVAAAATFTANLLPI